MTLESAASSAAEFFALCVLVISRAAESFVLCAPGISYAAEFFAPCTPAASHARCAADTAHRATVISLRPSLRAMTATCARTASRESSSIAG